MTKAFMRRTWRKAKPKEPTKKFWINEQIRTPEVFLIDEEGENVGQMPIQEALNRAREAGLDLVEVNPKADVSVAKIMNYGQFKYEQDKRAHKQRLQQKKVETKGLRLSVRISQHDFDFRLAQAKKFLAKGDKLKLELVLRGRERQHPEKARETINKFVSLLEAEKDFNIIKEQALTIQGGRVNIILANKQK